MVEVTIKMNFPSGTRVPDAVSDVIEKAVQVEAGAIVEVSGAADRASLAPKDVPQATYTQGATPPGISIPASAPSAEPLVSDPLPGAADDPTEEQIAALRSKRGRKSDAEKAMLAAYDARATAAASAAASQAPPSNVQQFPLPNGAMNTIPAVLDARLPGKALPGAVAPAAENPSPSSFPAPPTQQQQPAQAAPPPMTASAPPMPAAPPPPVIDPNAPVTIDTVKAAYQHLFNLPNGGSSVAFGLLNGNVWPGTGGHQKPSWMRIEEIPTDFHDYFMKQVHHLAGLVSSGQPIPS